MMASAMMFQTRGMSDGRMKGGAKRVVVLVLVGYSILGAVTVHRANTVGGKDRLGTYFREYSMGGSWKWRGAEGRAFEKVLRVWGVTSFLAAGTGLLVAGLSLIGRRGETALMISVAVAATGVVVWHLSEGILMAAFCGI